MIVFTITDPRAANNSNSTVANDNKETALSPQPNATANAANNNNVR